MGGRGLLGTEGLIDGKKCVMPTQLLVPQSLQPILENAYRRFWLLAIGWFLGWPKSLFIVKFETVFGGFAILRKIHVTKRT